MRESLEAHFPSYVNLLREHYGFSDEDPVERARVFAVLEEQRRPVCMHVCFGPGTVVEMTVDGEVLMESLVERVFTEQGVYIDSCTGLEAMDEKSLSITSAEGGIIDSLRSGGHSTVFAIDSAVEKRSHQGAEISHSNPSGAAIVTVGEGLSCSRWEILNAAAECTLAQGATFHLVRAHSDNHVLLSLPLYLPLPLQHPTRMIWMM